jgi:hypothetical protein
MKTCVWRRHHQPPQTPARQHQKWVMCVCVCVPFVINSFGLNTFDVRFIQISKEKLFIHTSIHINIETQSGKSIVSARLSSANNQYSFLVDMWIELIFASANGWKCVNGSRVRHNFSKQPRSRSFDRRVKSPKKQLFRTI